MPAGVSWPKYISFFVAAMASMAAGAQTVHVYYKPLVDLEVYVEKEIEKRHLDLKPEEVIPHDLLPGLSSPLAK